MTLESNCLILKKSCQICEEDCSKLDCSCICTCRPEYKNCLDQITERSNKKRSKEIFVDLNRLEERSFSSEKPKKFIYCANWQTCLKCSNHLDLKQCHGFRCSCLGNEINIQSVYNHLNKFNMNHCTKDSIKIKYSVSHATKSFFNCLLKSRLNRNLSSDQQTTTNQDANIQQTKQETTNQDVNTQETTNQEMNQQIELKLINIQSIDNQLSLKMSNLNNSLIRTYLNEPEIKITLNDVQKEVDSNFKKLIHHRLTDKILFSNLIKDFENSINKLRYIESENNPSTSGDQLQLIQRLNYNLDQDLNKSIRIQHQKSIEKDSKSDHRKANDTKLMNKTTKFNYMNKFELFVYLSLIKYDQVYKRIERSIEESKNAIGKNLILFINTKRIDKDNLIHSNIQLCLNTIDTIELNESSSFCSNLFRSDKFCFIFRYLNFLILNLNDDSIESIELKLDKLIVLRHLEIYGKQFYFKPNKWSNKSLINLIVHDKHIKNVNILQLFPNLEIMRIQNSSGNLLRSKSILNKLLNPINDHQRKLRAICLPNLTIDDFIYIINHCKNVELIEFTLIDQSMINFLNSLPNLKFIFLHLKKSDHKISNSIACSIYHHLIKNNSINILKYSNQLYCPQQIDHSNTEPCFLNLCPTHSKLIQSELNSNSNELANNKLFKSTSKPIIKSRSSSSTSNFDNDSSLNKDSINEEFKNLKDFDLFLDEHLDDLRPHISISNLQTDNLKQHTVYLNRIKLIESNARIFSKFSKITNIDHLKISELNRLIKLNDSIDLDLMKEAQFKCIEIDELIDLECWPILSQMTTHTNSLIVRLFDLNTIDNLIKKINYLKSIKFYNIEINKQISDQLNQIFNRFWIQLNKIEIHYDITDQDKVCCIEFLKECESLTELKILNAIISKNLLIDLLTRNTYCTNIELSYPATKLAQLNLVEILTFNAIVHRHLNFNLKFDRNDFLDVNLLSNFKIKG